MKSRSLTLAALAASPAAASGVFNESLKDVANCVGDGGVGTTPCRPGHQVCPPGAFGANTPQFHVKDASCGENDPNGEARLLLHSIPFKV
jgi:hypothetical protein